ncbi:MAG: DEAD/DEAH box helicase [Pseudomonadota bacterium]
MSGNPPPVGGPPGPNPRQLLRRTWPVFFRRFGRLLPVQEAALAPVAAGRNTVVCAPAASGKTEAVFAPLLERMLHFHLFEENRVSVLYVAPTRALVNDMAARLKDAATALGLSAVRRTGDHRELVTDQPAPILLTTPESLDSLLCRHPGIFAARMAVILDELHVLDGHHRGDQLRVLMRRLEADRPDGIRYAALSATLADPVAIAGRYFPVEALVEGPPPRPFRLEMVETVEEIPAAAARLEASKLLVFCNTRARTEEVANILRRLVAPVPVAIHHGSLDRRERLDIEAAVREWRRGICVATSTLEVGIDIGDVDAVALADLPSLPSAFQQRITRGSRRYDHVRVVLVTPTEEDRDAAHILLDMARTGTVEERDAPPDPSVIVQQIFSLGYAHRDGITREMISGLLEPVFGEVDTRRIVEHLVQQGHLSLQHNRLFPSEEILDLGDKGLIHSNIPDTRERELVDAATGRVLGRGALGVAAGSVVLFGGRMWSVASVEGGRAVLSAASGEGGAAKFRARSDAGAFARYLP